MRNIKKHNYKIAYNNKILVKNDIFDKLKNIDTIVFDIDGVLVNSEKSFIETICRTVNYYFKNILKFDISKPLIEPKEVYLFKDAGGFNNDYDLTSAIIIFYLIQSRKCYIKNNVILKEKTPNIKRFTSKTLRAGGGLENILDLLETLTPDDKRWVIKNWNKELIDRIFKEIYAGTILCKDIYGFSPTIIKSEGLTKYEKILIKKKQETFLNNYCLGLLTGRTKGETDILLEKLDFLNMNKKNNIYTSDDGPEKPNPHGLINISRNCNTKCGLFIGDIRDDLFTVKNFNKLFKNECKYYSCIIKPFDIKRLEKSTNIRLYLEHEVDIVAYNVNHLLEWLKISIIS